MYVPTNLSINVGFGDLFVLFVSPILVISTDKISYSDVGIAVTTPIYLRIKIRVKNKSKSYEN